MASIAGRPETLRFATPQFRKMPDPSSKAGEIGVFYTLARTIPEDLWNWREVNPRDANEKKTDPVGTAIEETLAEAPEQFSKRNRGLTLSVESMKYDENTHEVLLTLSNKEIHGVIDGGSTLYRILTTFGKIESEDVDQPTDEVMESNVAQVFFKVHTGITSEEIVDIAGGLNRSAQVDKRSLLNAAGCFKGLKETLDRQPFGTSIAYYMNERDDDGNLKPIDVRYVLFCLELFNCAEYDGMKHPEKRFGRKEGIVRDLEKEVGSGIKKGPYSILFSKAPDILKLRDLVEKAMAESPKIGRLKVVRKRKVNLAFLGGTAPRRVPFGWVAPILGAFRANVDWNAEKGTFDWKYPNNQELLNDCLEEMLEDVRTIHQSPEAGGKSEYVGRSRTAWRNCYLILEKTLARRLSPSRR